VLNVSAVSTNVSYCTSFSRL